MKLRTKILGGYGLIFVLALFVGLWAIVNLYRLGQASDAILRENYRSILAAERMLAAVERQDSLVLSSLLSGTRDAAAFRDNEIDFLQWLARAQDNVTLADETAALAEIEAAYGAFLDAANQLDAPNSDGATAIDAYYEYLFPAFLNVREATVKLRDMNQEAMLAASNATQRIASNAVWSTSLVGLIAAATGIIFSLVLASRLSRPLRAMTAATEKIAGGEYDVFVPHDSEDEIGQLARQINEMSQKLKTFQAMNVDQMIAEKQRSEAILRSISDGVLLVDASGHVVTLNPKAAQIFQTSLLEAQGRHLYDLAGNQPLCDHVRTAVETNQTLNLSDDEAILAFGEAAKPHYFRHFVSPVTTEKNKPLGVVVLLQDVTDLKHLDQLKDEFVMTVSHELRTPLTGIGMSIDLLREDLNATLTPRQNELMQVAHDDVERLKALINDLLDLSKIQAGHITMSFDAIPVALLTTKALLPFETQAQEKEITLINAASEMQTQVWADANKITWVLTNLIANALRFVEPGGCITVAASPRNDWVYLSVKDDGLGIPLQYQSHIFDKFVQVKNNQTSGGTGLGLAISKEIVKAHGGSIWVDSAPDEGSTFTFTLRQIHADNA